ncbi:MAG: MFS transporter, partial [Gammaproteobacteria bacterium]
MTTPVTPDTQALRDVKQLGLAASIASLGYVFWIVGGMEMVERLAYYGVRAVSGLYVTAPVSEGGLGVTAEDLGAIFFIWALFQSLVPALVGGLSDRIGYKQTIFLSTVVKIVAYLIMAFFPSFWGF